MQMFNCESSQIAAYGYEPEAREMQVEFTRGGTYRYRDVPQETFEAFLRAESKGSFHYHAIRGKFPFEKL